MAIGLKALAEGRGDAFVSAGSTGALVAGATLLVKRIRGVRRAAIASVLPSNEAPFLLMDCGANVECTAQMLDQFGAMGSFYMQKVLGVEQPRVGLANIGTVKNQGRAAPAGGLWADGGFLLPFYWQCRSARRPLRRVRRAGGGWLHGQYASKNV